MLCRLKARKVILVRLTTASKHSSVTSKWHVAVVLQGHSSLGLDQLHWLILLVGSTSQKTLVLARIIGICMVSVLLMCVEDSSWSNYESQPLTVSYLITCFFFFFGYSICIMKKWVEHDGYHFYAEQVEGIYNPTRILHNLRQILFYVQITLSHPIFPHNKRWNTCYLRFLVTQTPCLQQKHSNLSHPVLVLCSSSMSCWKLYQTALTVSKLTWWVARV